MPVGVGLDDRPDLGIRRGGAALRKILAQCLQMDGGLNRTGHGKPESRNTEDAHFGSLGQRAWRAHGATKTGRNPSDAVI